MGIDFLDMNFRIEKRFGVRPSLDAWMEIVAESGRKRDFRAADICALVERCLQAKRNSRSGDQSDPPIVGNLSVLQYESRHRLGSRDFEFFGDVWPALREVIAETLSVSVENVKPESLLRRDLGME
jgi:acyl carrier protein